MRLSPEAGASVVALSPLEAWDSLPTATDEALADLEAEEDAEEADA